MVRALPSSPPILKEVISSLGAAMVLLYIVIPKVVLKVLCGPGCLVEISLIGYKGSISSGVITEYNSSTRSTRYNFT